MNSRIMECKGVRVHVTSSGRGRALLCLHGWAASDESFTELRDALKDASVQIIAPDLPGAGESDDPPSAWSVDDYADCVEDIVSQLAIDNVILLGHSFGGRIAIKLASRKRAWIKHLILCGAAGIRHPRHWRRTIGIIMAEMGKMIFRIPGLRQFESFARKVLYKILRVHDYEKTSGVMRDTMIKVINEDLTPLLDQIDVKTDLFWGEKDSMTPLADAKLMNKKIVHSSLHQFPGVGHRVHREKAEEIAEVIHNNL